ncbi:MAG: PEP-CTERM/exosortase system-associated acyltransferase [Betaproteobacteria bacterium]|nr:PEP-CTERM/exosortase system-associated acyltransferase [Betaproteobacteria bacterium]
MNPLAPNLGESFRQLFQISIALNETDREEVFRIRHDVYCKDLHWEPEQASGMESDHYDGHSIHCLIRTNEAPPHRVGCVRLVIPSPDNPSEQLPLEESCANTLDRSLFDPATQDRRHIAEVSRLAIVNSFRRRKDEEREPGTIQSRDFGTEENPRFPFIPVGLYLAGYAVAEFLDLENTVVLTEPRLAKHFNRIGFDIRQIGGPIEHRGTRIPSVMHIPTAIKNMRPMLQPMWQLIRDKVQEDFKAAGPNPLPWLPESAFAS